MGCCLCAPARAPIGFGAGKNPPREGTARGTYGYTLIWLKFPLFPKTFSNLLNPESCVIFGAFELLCVIVNYYLLLGKKEP